MACAGAQARPATHPEPPAQPAVYGAAQKGTRQHGRAPDPEGATAARHAGAGRLRGRGARGRAARVAPAALPEPQLLPNLPRQRRVQRHREPLRLEWLLLPLTEGTVHSRRL